MNDNFDSTQPISATNNPLEGKSQEEIGLHFDNLKNTLVGSVATNINQTLSGASGAINQVGNLVNGLHSVIDAMASEMAIFHQFEHAIRTGADDLGAMWIEAEQKLEALRAEFKSKSEVTKGDETQGG